MYVHPRVSETAVLATALLVLATALVAVTDRDDGLTDLERLLLAHRPVGEPASDWFLSARGGATGLDPSAGIRARAEAADVRERTSATDPALAGAPWTWLGPRNIGGRVLDLALDPADAGTVYVATAGGGVWKSTDAGVTLAPSWPEVAPQAVAAITAAPDGTLYAGTGEPPPGGGSITWGGDGVYRSTDGARTWEHAGLTDSGTISEIVVDPRGTIWVASMGHGFAEGGQRGLYRSDDDGETWTLALAAPDGRTGASDIAIDPADPDHLFVTMWQRMRLPDRRIYGGPSSTVWESRDGGTSWKVVEAITAQDPRREPGRIALAFAPSDADRVYAMVVDDLGGFDSFYRSDDGGTTWTQTGGDTVLDASQSSYGWWFGRLWVDPDEPDVLFAGGVDLVWSDDAGDSWLPQSSTLAGVVTGVVVVNPHADQHAMVWDERVPGRVYLGNDGGLYRSDADGRLDWKGALQQGFTQHYSVGVSQQQPSRVVSGLQDNMCQRNYVAGDLGRPETWTKYGLCGDGLQTLIHPADDRIVYGCAQYGGNCSRSDDGGGTFLPMSIPGSRHNWWVPIVFDPSDPTVLYAGSNVVSVGATAGGVRPGQAAFRPISPDLTSMVDGGAQPDPQYKFGTITTLAVAPSDGNVLYAGTDEGWLWRGVRETQWSWERIDTESGVPEDERVLPDGLSWVSRVAVDPKDADVAYATFSRYRNGEDTPLVVRTTDGGMTWTDITGDLPDAPVNEIVVIDDGARLVVGTDVGVFLSDDGGTTWKAVGTGLPAIPVLDLAVHTGTDALSGVSTTSLTAATFGRGVMRVTLPPTVG